MVNNKDDILHIAHDLVRAEQLFNRLVDKLLDKLGITREEVENNGRYKENSIYRSSGESSD